MGMRQKLDDTERRLKVATEDAARLRRVADSTRNYIATLAQMPEDAVLSYSLSGMCVSHEIGKSARILLAELDTITP